MALTIRERCNSIFSGLDSDFSSWEPHYREIAEFTQPRRQRFNLNDTNKISYVNGKIIDPYGTLALRESASGMYSGITSPSAQWIRFTVADKDLEKFHSVRLYLNHCAELVLQQLAKTNFYNVAPSVFLDIIGYSTASVGIEKDEYSVVRFYPNPVGTYRIANSHRMVVNTHGRKAMWTTEQIVSRFGLDNVSNAVKTAYNSRNYNSQHEVRHLVFDNPDFVPSAFSAVHKKYCSIWYEPGNDRDQVLSRSGFDRFPFLTPRWEAVGMDAYGSFGPGMLALGSIKGLQIDQRNKHTANALQIKPPMVGPESLRNSGATLVPGGLTFVDAMQGQQGFTPAFQTNFSTAEALRSIEDTRAIIDQAFFRDLFRIAIDVDKSGVTATEMLQRKEEKLLMLGPVLSRFDEEFLDPTVQITFSEMNRRGMLPPAPPEIDGIDIEIRYEGLLHQAQRAAGIASIERSLGFIGNLSQTFPQVLDKVNIDAAVDIYTDITGTTPRILNDDQTVAQIREQRAQEAQAQEMAQSVPVMEQSASAAKLLSETNTGGSTGLSELMRMMS